MADLPREFLLEKADPSVRYFALRDLLDRPEDDPELLEARTAIGRNGWAAKILADQADAGHWEAFRGDGDDLYLPKYIATNWRMLVLADLGMTGEDPRIERATQLILTHWAGGAGDVFGGSGSELCITGNTVRMMVRFGHAGERRVAAAIDWLVHTQKADGGWHCFESDSGTIDGWEALAAFAAMRPADRSASIDRAIERGAEFYLERGLLRESDGSTYPPWSRLHYPNHYYYDLLVGLDMLTALGYGDDPRILPPIRLLEAKRRSDGTWSLDAVHPDLEPSDPYHPHPPVYPFLLEHPGLPSRWATLLALRVLRRAGRL